MLRIDSDACIGCGVCEEVCSFGAIRVGEEGYAVVDDSCTLCGTCVDNCEAEAITIDRAAPGAKTDLDQWSGVWVFAEFRHGRIAPVAFELLGKGRELADQLQTRLAAVLFGSDLGDTPGDLIAHGADTVYVVDDPALAHFTDEVYGNVLEDLIREVRPEIVLAGATVIGRSFIPRVANGLDTGLTADCTELAIRLEDRTLLQTRPAFGGNIMATIVCPHTRPQMATVRPRVMKALSPDPTRQGEVVSWTPQPDRLRSRVRVLRSVVEEQDAVNICEADVIIAGGRGLENEKGFALVRQLAAAMGGAVAASRAAVDSGWISYHHQVGQTGKTVCPKVYIACGISGAIQHVVGMQSADMIVAVNRDPDAPIFDIANYGIVGDLFEVIPLLTRKIEQRSGK